MKNDLTVLNLFEEVTHDELLEVDGGFVITALALGFKGGAKAWKAMSAKQRANWAVSATVETGFHLTFWANIRW